MCVDSVVLIESSVALVMCPTKLRVRQHGVATCSPFHPTKELVVTQLRQRISEDMEVRNFALNTQLLYLQQVSLFARYLASRRTCSGARTFGPIRSIDQREEAGARLDPQ